MQSLAQVLDLVGAQLGMIAASALAHQCGHALLAIGATPYYPIYGLQDETIQWPSNSAIKLRHCRSALPP